MITAGGTFMKMVNTIGTQLNNYGAASKLRRQPDQLQQRQDRLPEHRPWIADRCGSGRRNSAQLQALQIRQQLGTQSLSIANQAPQTLLSLFK